jgi:hypothetical protein
MSRRIAAAAVSLVVLFCLGAGAGAAGPVLSDRSFYVRALGSRCLDFGGQSSWAVGSPVFIYGCNGTIAQQVRVKEIDATHDVELRVQSLFCIGVRGGVVVVGKPLELQLCNGSAAQRFALDGDSILMGSQGSRPVVLRRNASPRVTREYAIEPEDDATTLRTPLVVGTRDLSDAEYFRLRAVDGSGVPPTTGFVRVSTGPALDRALALGWGTVIEVDDRRPLTITGSVPKRIQAGVTLRGYRKLIDQGPLILAPRSAAFAAGDHATFLVAEDHVRITGLRLQGPTREDDTGVPKVAGIEISSSEHALTDVIVDHVDASDWTDGAVNVLGSIVPPDPTKCLDTLRYPRPTPVRIVRNFIHHNVGGHGYGVVTGNGAFTLVEGNVEYMNKHSIAADGAGTTGYVAQDNLVLARSPSGPYDSDQSFDSHGSLHPGSWYGGTAGDVFDIGWNTFLPTTHRNFAQRGTPCHYSLFHDNVSVQARSAVVSESPSPRTLIVPDNNTFRAADPTSDLAVGDFDGDGVGDVFLGTGATWWFSSGGQAEWRFLNRMPGHAGSLRLGDFDGDGRTDVLAVRGPLLQVSWSGVSPWSTVAATGASIADVAVGDFDGDRVSDVFVARGGEWLYAAGGRTWTHLAYSPLRTSELRFGDFTGDGKTDVFGIVGNEWRIVRGGGTGSWETLGPALASTVDGLVVADFGTDGVADVVRTSGGSWQVSTGGRSGWSTLRAAAGPPLAVGRFDGDKSADAIVWDGRYFAIAPGGRNPLKTPRRQDMR